jgi:hypothetical protein
VWGGLLELAGLVPDGELDEGALAAGSEAVRDTPSLAAAMDEMLGSAERRGQLHRMIVGLLGHGHRRWLKIQGWPAYGYRGGRPTRSGAVGQMVRSGLQLLV